MQNLSETGKTKIIDLEIPSIQKNRDSSFSIIENGQIISSFSNNDIINDKVIIEKDNDNPSFSKIIFKGDVEEGITKYSFPTSELIKFGLIDQPLQVPPPNSASINPTAARLFLGVAISATVVAATFTALSATSDSAMSGATSNNPLNEKLRSDNPNTSSLHVHLKAKACLVSCPPAPAPLFPPAPPSPPPATAPIFPPAPPSPPPAPPSPPPAIAPTTTEKPELSTPINSKVTSFEQDPTSATLSSEPLQTQLAPTSFSNLLTSTSSTISALDLASTSQLTTSKLLLGGSSETLSLISTSSTISALDLASTSQLTTSKPLLSASSKVSVAQTSVAASSAQPTALVSGGPDQTSVAASSAQPTALVSGGPDQTSVAASSAQPTALVSGGPDQTSVAASSAQPTALVSGGPDQTSVAASSSQATAQVSGAPTSIFPTPAPTSGDASSSQATALVSGGPDQTSVAASSSQATAQVSGAPTSIFPTPAPTSGDASSSQATALVSGGPDQTSVAASSAQPTALVSGGPDQTSVAASSAEVSGVPDQTSVAASSAQPTAQVSGGPDQTSVAASSAEVSGVPDQTSGAASSAQPTALVSGGPDQTSVAASSALATAQVSGGPDQTSVAASSAEVSGVPDQTSVAASSAEVSGVPDQTSGAASSAQPTALVSGGPDQTSVAASSAQPTAQVSGAPTSIFPTPAPTSGDASSSQATALVSGGPDQTSVAASSAQPTAQVSGAPTSIFPTPAPTSGDASSSQATALISGGPDQTSVAASSAQPTALVSGGPDQTSVAASSAQVSGAQTTPNSLNSDNGLNQTQIGLIAGGVSAGLVLAAGLFASRSRNTNDGKDRNAANNSQIERILKEIKNDNEDSIIKTSKQNQLYEILGIEMSASLGFQNKIDGWINELQEKIDIISDANIRRRLNENITKIERLATDYIETNYSDHSIDNPAITSSLLNQIKKINNSLKEDLIKATAGKPIVTGSVEFSERSISSVSIVNSSELYSGGASVRTSPRLTESFLSSPNNSNADPSEIKILMTDPQESEVMQVMEPARLNPNPKDGRAPARLNKEEEKILPSLGSLKEVGTQKSGWTVESQPKVKQGPVLKMAKDFADLADQERPSTSPSRPSSPTQEKEIQ